MLRSAPGPLDRLAADEHRALASADDAARSPAISRSTVDLPQPDGPRIAMNSPVPGRSGTQKVTSRMTVSVAEALGDVRELDDVGAGRGLGRRGRRARPRLVLDLAVGEQAALEDQNSTRSMP